MKYRNAGTENVRATGCGEVAGAGDRIAAGTRAAHAAADHGEVAA